MRRALCALLCVLCVNAVASAACVPYTEAGKHIGATKCVSGTVVKVTQSPKGNFFLNFCADYKTCPFNAVVFPADLRDVGDVRWLEGRDVELHGKIQIYDGRAEIILRDARQLRGEAARIPPLPKNFDASRRGSYSAGQFKRPKSKKPARPKRDRPTRTPGDPDNPEQ
jgi:hypothetical protein